MMMIYIKFMAHISEWWSNINLKTRVMVFMTLLISLVMSGLTFCSLTIIQEDSIITDTRFCQDLGTLFASNIIDFVETNNKQELASFVEKIYLNTSSIRYILLFHTDGNLFFSLPVYNNEVQSLLQLHRNLFQLETQNFFFGIPLVKYNSIFNDYIIDITIPLTKNGKNFGSLDLGINLNPILVSSSRLIRSVSMAIFVSIWLMVIIGIVFHMLTLTEPIKQLLLGIKNISSGNFNQRIDLSFDGELGDLIVGFNDMAECLESYEKKNVDKLMLEKLKLETVVSTIADGAILVDTELRVLFVNQIATKAFNWSNPDVIGQRIFFHLPSHVNEALLPILNSLIKSHYLQDMKYQTKEVCINLDYDLKKTFRFLLTTVLEHRSNVLTGIAIIVQDISREVQLNHAQNQFISNVSHELRTPLSSISSFLETLLDYDNILTIKQKVHFLKIANNETKRLSTLVNDVLNLSRLESVSSYVLKPVDIISIINDSINASYLIANYNNIEIIFEYDPRIKCVWAHENSLLQVFANLISNSIKFTPSNGSIVLRLHILTSSYINQGYMDISYQKSIRVEIIDEGIGIDKIDQKNIFQRFVRMENHVHILEGTGLGLSIVTDILSKHKTKIMLQSQPCVGTSLWFDLIKVD
uniref:drug sensory protein A n=1 Tax=Hypnea pseudomusciformis TaxID=1545697 RepID=UPI0027DA2AFB|nr:drug sensory protein A [Hypnea pseudomusciformis]WCH55068.1 drug sensory protein A [Hypnea pseudomusciformis]